MIIVNSTQLTDRTAEDAMSLGTPMGTNYSQITFVYYKRVCS